MTEATTRRLLAGRYEIGEYIGQGGMSTVYRGVDTKLGRSVAIKIMKANLATDEEFRNRFRQEARAASRMAHPSIVRVFDAGDELINTGTETQRLPFIVMEYVNGKNLREVVTEKPLSIVETTRVVDALLTALEYSHRAGIVHRDIKLANVMISETGHVKVMDFGIARAVSDTSSTLQQTTAILGTAAYFSPEQAKGETVDARTDLYSTGIVLFELLTGQVPFTGDTAVAVAYQHVSERPRTPSTVNPEIPAEYDRVVLHALAKDRTKRFQSADEFKEALKLASEGVMPKLAVGTDATEVLFSPGEQLSDSELALRQLTESATAPRSQPRPPVMWTWSAILTVIAVIAAVMYWLLQFTPAEINVTNTRTIPNLSGATQQVAMSTLRDLDLVGVPVEKADEEITAGLVIDTYPEVGENVELGTTVRIHVSTGPVQASVPNLSGLNLDSATSELERLGLQVGNTRTVDDPLLPGGSIISTSPVSGESVGAGSAVDLTVSSGKVMVPDVKGHTMSEARKMLDEVRVIAQETPVTSCQQQDNLPIIQMSGFGQMEQRSTVIIYYCSG